MPFTAALLATHWRSAGGGGPGGGGGGGGGATDGLVGTGRQALPLLLLLPCGGLAVAASALGQGVGGGGGGGGTLRQKNLSNITMMC